VLEDQLGAPDVIKCNTSRTRNRLWQRFATHDASMVPSNGLPIVAALK
jgi:hypothetical protein